jgi:hypothetical protein
MLSTITGGVVASLLTKFMFLYDKETKFHGMDLAKYIRQHDADCEGDDAAPLIKTKKRLASQFHGLGSLLRVRPREHI